MKNYTNEEVIINIPVTPSGEFTSYLFYDKFLPEISEYRKNYDKLKYKDLILNFEKVNKINPLVIPNMLCIGKGLKKLRHVTTVMDNLSGDAACLVSKTNFKLMSENEFLFKFRNFDSYNLTDWEKRNDSVFYLEYIDFSDNLKQYCEADFETKEYIYHRGTNEILNSINETSETAREIFYEKKEQIEESRLKDLAESMENNVIKPLISHERDVKMGLLLTYLVESVKNSIMHGLSGCYVLVYSRRFKGVNKYGIAVSDIGKGIPDSINAKYKRSSSDDTNKFIFKKEKIAVFDKIRGLSKKEIADLNTDYATILEALFYRTIRRPLAYRYFDCGLFDVVKSILQSDKNGIVKIHSHFVQIKFTNNFYKKHFSPFIISEKDKKIDWDRLAEHLRKNVVSEDERYSNIVATPLFGGTHLEYEFEQNMQEDK